MAVFDEPLFDDTLFDGEGETPPTPTPGDVTTGRVCVQEASLAPVAHIVGQPIPVAILIRTYDNRAAEPLPICCPCEID